MTELSEAEIEHLALLARIQLTPEEKSRFGQELPKIVEFVEALQELQGRLTEVGLVPVEMTQLRDDVVGGEQLSLDTLQKLAPAWRDNQVEVPAVFGQSDEAAND